MSDFQAVMDLAAGAIAGAFLCLSLVTNAKPTKPKPSGLVWPYGLRWLVKGRSYVHTTRGKGYLEIGHAELQSSAPVVEGAVLVVYLGTDGKLWCRPESEFYDGRFVEFKLHSDD